MFGWLVRPANTTVHAYDRVIDTLADVERRNAQWLTPPYRTVLLATLVVASFPNLYNALGITFSRLAKAT